MNNRTGGRSMEVYDTICDNYKKHIFSCFERKATAEHSFFKYLGDVRGKSVLDLGCGEGYYARPIKMSGAGKVVGVDISDKMIAMAREEEKRSLLGINYERYDAAYLPKMGQFDIVTAVFLLHYARSKDELSKMCGNIYKNLKPGGRFVALNNNPDDPLQPDGKYGYTITCDRPLAEGCAIRISLYLNGKPACSFDNYYWDKKTYEDALKGAGFKTVTWHNIAVSEEGIARFGHQFWQACLKQPGIIVIECHKPKG